MRKRGWLGRLGPERKRWVKLRKRAGGGGAHTNTPHPPLLLPFLLLWNEPFHAWKKVKNVVHQRSSTPPPLSRISVFKPLFSICAVRNLSFFYIWLFRPSVAGFGVYSARASTYLTFSLRSGSVLQRAAERQQFEIVTNSHTRAYSRVFCRISDCAQDAQKHSALSAHRQHASPDLSRSGDRPPGTVAAAAGGSAAAV